MTECPSRFTLVQFHVDDLPSFEARSVSAHLATCDRCTEDLRVIRENSTAFEQNIDQKTAKLVERLESIVPEARKKPFPARFAAIAGIITASAAALLSAFFLFRAPEPGPTGTAPRSGNSFQDAPAYKGTFSVQIIARRADAQFEVKEDTTLHPADQLRFVITAGSPGYLSILSMTESGQVSPFYPDTTPSDSPLPLSINTAGKHELPGSIVLDETEGTEYLIVLFSKDLFDRREIHNRLHPDLLKNRGQMTIGGVSSWRVRITKDNE